MLTLRKFILCFYIALIGYLSLLPTHAIPNVGNWDKLNHGVAYGLMSLLAAWSIRSPRLFFSLVPLWVIYGGGIEIIQAMVGRHGSWLDACANFLGVFAGVYLAKYIVCSSLTNRYFALGQNYA